MSIVFKGTIENFDTLFKQVETNVKNKKGDVFIDPEFLSENKEFRKLFSTGTGMKEEDFDFTDVKRERDLVIKFKSELIKKINSIIIKQKDSINLPYYQTVKLEIESETNKYELEKINKELEKKYDTFVRQEVEKLVKNSEVFLQEIKASTIFSKKSDFKYFVNLTEEIRNFLQFIKLYNGLINLFREMKLTLPNIDVSELIENLKKGSDIEKGEGLYFFKSKFDNESLAIEIEGKKYVINLTRDNEQKFVNLKPILYIGTKFNENYEQIDDDQLKVLIKNNDEAKQVEKVIIGLFGEDQQITENIPPELLPPPVSQTLLSSPKSKEKIKIMSYNILNNANMLHKKNIINLINHEKPDILMAQEADWIIADPSVNLPEFGSNYQADSSSKYVTSIIYYNPEKFVYLNSYDGSDITNKDIKSRGVIGVKLKVISNDNIVNLVTFHMKHYRDQLNYTIEEVSELRRELLKIYLDNLNYKPGEEVILGGDSNEFYDEAILKPQGISTKTLNLYPTYPFRIILSDNSIIDIYFKDAKNEFSCCKEESNPFGSHRYRTDIIGTTNNNFDVVVPQYELDGEREDPRKWFSDHRSIISYLDI